MTEATVLSIFLPTFLTLVTAVGGVFVFRGQYYKSLSKRMDELEEKEQKGYIENQRLRSENETLRRLVTGEIALEKLVDLYREHEKEAGIRHSVILGKIDELLRRTHERAVNS